MGDFLILLWFLQNYLLFVVNSLHSELQGQKGQHGMVAVLN